MNDNDYISQIQQEYDKINCRWLQLHRKIVLCSAIVSLAMEIIMFFLLTSMDGGITASPVVYLAKYIFAPCALNIIFLILIYLSTRNQITPMRVREYVVSLCFVAICCSLFFIHNIFSALYLLFAIPIMMTTVYGNYLLTTVTAAASLLSLTAGELWITWDPDKVSILSNEDAFVNFLISIIILTGFYSASLVVIHFERQKNQASIIKELERYQMHQELLTDHLTGLYNRTALQEAFNDLETKKLLDTCCLVMVDIDNFKTVNDTLGHLKGDECLIAFSSILQEHSAPHPVYRFGGDEICILFQGISLDQTLAICRECSQSLEDYCAHTLAGLPISASFGVACGRPDLSLYELLKNADTALYESKKQKGSISVYQ